MAGRPVLPSCHVMAGCLAMRAILADCLVLLLPFMAGCASVHINSHQYDQSHTVTPAPDATQHIAHRSIRWLCLYANQSEQERTRASKSELEQIRIVLVVTAAAAAHVSGLQSEDEGTICQSRLMCAAGYAQIQN